MLLAAVQTRPAHGYAIAKSPARPLASRSICLRHALPGTPQRGLAEVRVVKEARVHFVDAIEDAMQHGLTVGAAEREAFDRSGTPETVASQFGAERHATLKRFLFVVEKTRLSATRRGGVRRLARPAGRRCGTRFI